MKSLLSSLAAAAISLALASGAAAQTEPEAPAPTRLIGGPLAGINVVQMTLAPLSEQSRACGMKDDVILQLFGQPLAEKGIVVQDAALIWIQLKATTLIYEDNLCISYIEASAVQTTRYFDRKTETERSGRVLLWTDGGLFVTGKTNHAAGTNIGWRDLARGFVRKWSMDQ